MEDIGRRGARCPPVQSTFMEAQLNARASFPSRRTPAHAAGPTLDYALFATRWLQAPLYFGLVAAQTVAARRWSS
ncbi:hypothetical protein GCM10010211_83280 [Streptomyces albospinus]|uniref:Uncharacterized protein n=1 Tax=Streptomyces albospinus TaxID=285515 RepID=A0ABQ2VQP4_9ACTN|nr:hypothetical protein GCM10010211_83280 [Streptomyces albospinus]